MNDENFQLRLLTRGLLYIATAFMVGWGLLVWLRPDLYCAWAGVEMDYLGGNPDRWGMFGVLGGLFYLAIALMPTRLPLAILPGVLIGVAGIVITMTGLVKGNLSLSVVLVQWAGELACVLGCLLAAVDLYRRRRQIRFEASYVEGGKASPLLGSYAAHTGERLADMSEGQPIMLVFLRHFGCTFCREALGDLYRLQSQIAARGVRPVVVHMVDDTVAEQHMTKFGLGHIARVSDPSKALYGAFELRRGTFGQLYGIDTWVEGMRAGLLEGHSVGSEVGDNTQMPGVFLVHKGEIIRAFRHATASTRADFCALAECN
jgi:AhpC/TSA family